VQEKEVEKFADRMKSIASATPGWRVVYLRSKAPWVDVHPIACWGLSMLSDREVGYVVPLIRGKNGVWLVQPDEERHWKVSRPDEDIELYVEMAKEYRRERARQARKARRERQKAGAGKQGSVATGEDAQPRTSQPPKKPSRTRRPRIHPKVKAIRQGLLWRAVFDLDAQESRDVLIHFLGRGCRLGQGRDAGADELYGNYCKWCGVFDVKPMARATVSNLLKEKLDLKPTKKGTRIVHWKGISASRETIPERPAHDKSVEGRRARVQDFNRFLSEQVRQKDHGHESLDFAFGCYRAWCRREGLYPLSRKMFAKQMNTALPPGRRSSDGGGGWSGIECIWPD